MYRDLHFNQNGQRSSEARVDYPCFADLNNESSRINVDAQIKEWKSEKYHLFALPPVGHYFKKIKRALVVDDDLDMARFITQQLKRQKCRVESCTDGYDALEKLVTENYDLVIMDWSLPGISGGEVLRKTDEFVDFDSLTSEKWGVKKKPVVIVSGHDINRIHFPLVEKFEIVDFWSKQIGPSALVKKMRNVVQQNFSLT
jgi:CheY-like chemotaxis protein